MRSEQTKRFPEICLGQESQDEGEDIGGVALGEGEKIAGGKDCSSFREPTAVLKYHISMNGRHRRLFDAPRHVVVVRWVEVDFSVPVRSGAKRPRSGTGKRPSFRGTNPHRKQDHHWRTPCRSNKWLYFPGRGSPDRAEPFGGVA